MIAHRALTSTLTSLTFSAIALAPAAAANDWFVAADTSIDQLQGSSDTTTGGAVWAGDGTVHNVKFGDAYSFGAMIGRRIAENWALGVSYRHLEADVDFYANFTCCAASRYIGETMSDLFLVNAIYSAPLSGDGRWMFQTTVGAGVALNELDLWEDFDPWDGVADMTIERGDTSELTLRASAGLSYALDERWAVHAQAFLFDLGSFETGDTRSAPSEPIGSYELDAWGYGVGLGVSARF
jgi:opacity protein-like surface antigen